MDDDIMANPGVSWHAMKCFRPKTQKTLILMRAELTAHFAFTSSPIPRVLFKLDSLNTEFVWRQPTEEEWIAFCEQPEETYVPPPPRVRRREEGILVSWLNERFEEDPVGPTDGDAPTSPPSIDMEQPRTYVRSHNL